ncbi:hypothetical protein NUW54_g5878 [Trametes sanguinea]|uniref:Uncharacterized protein n=1 Tax=Trametes sanguinea TaxID=158606 RepID=A0ACC1PTU5_9APHY|nr:hypothetical protein NUW54_g5878 [Trametes sanguinea]
MASTTLMVARDDKYDINSADALQICRCNPSSTGVQLTEQQPPLSGPFLTRADIARCARPHCLSPAIDTSVSCTRRSPLVKQTLVAVERAKVSCRTSP